MSRLKRIIIYLTLLFQPLDFDKYFKVKDCEGLSPNIVQSFIDNGYIVLYRGDYNCHNTFLFTLLCDKAKIGKRIKLNGKTYKVISKSYGVIRDNNVWVDDEPVYDNDLTQVLYCDGDGRFVMLLGE